MNRNRVALIAVAILLTCSLIVTAIIQWIPYADSSRLIQSIRDGDIEKVEYYLESGTDPNTPNLPPSKFWSFFEMGVDYPICVACSESNYSMVKLLTDHGASVTIQEQDRSPLLEAIVTCNGEETVRIVKLLVECGADCESVEGDYSPVFYAADQFPFRPGSGDAYYEETVAESITEIVDTLLGDESVDIKTDRSQTLLMFAARRGNLHLVKYLLSKNCDVTVQEDGSNRTAYDFAVENGHTEIAELIMS